MGGGLQLRKISVRRAGGENSPGADNSHPLDSISINNMSPPPKSHLYNFQNRKLSENKYGVDQSGKQPSRRQSISDVAVYPHAVNQYNENNSNEK